MDFYLAEGKKINEIKGNFCGFFFETKPIILQFNNRHHSLPNSLTF